MYSRNVHVDLTERWYQADEMDRGPCIPRALEDTDGQNMKGIEKSIKEGSENSKGKTWQGARKQNVLPAYKPPIKDILYAGLSRTGVMRLG